MFLVEVHSTCTYMKLFSFSHDKKINFYPSTTLMRGHSIVS